MESSLDISWYNSALIIFTLWNMITNLINYNIRKTVRSRLHRFFVIYDFIYHISIISLMMISITITTPIPLKIQIFAYFSIGFSTRLHFHHFSFVLLHVSVASWHSKTSYGSFFHSTIGGLFFLLSVFTGLVHLRTVCFRNKRLFIERQ